MKHTRTVALAVDGSFFSAVGVRWFVSTLLAPGDRVLLVHVIYSYSLFPKDEEGNVIVSAEMKESVDNLFKKMKSLFFETHQANSRKDVRNSRLVILPSSDAFSPTDVIFEGHVLFGNPIQALSEFCLDQKCDFLVMGCGGMNHKKNNPVGSVSQGCVKCCECPVIVVKDQSSSQALRLSHSTQFFFPD
eukprot:Sdes_comp24396_c0_seq1m22333